GVNIEEYALKVIDFNYDYSLCDNAPGNSQEDVIDNGVHINSEKGKLTLKELIVKTLGGVQVAPSYKFEYYDNDATYKEKNFDYWGTYIERNALKSDLYDKDYANNWSLKKIVTPAGGEYNIVYESDSYVKEAVYDGLFFGLNKHDFNAETKIQTYTSGNEKYHLLSLELSGIDEESMNLFSIDKEYDILVQFNTEDRYNNDHMMEFYVKRYPASIDNATNTITFNIAQFEEFRMKYSCSFNGTIHPNTDDISIFDYTTDFHVYNTMFVGCNSNYKDVDFELKILGQEFLIKKKHLFLNSAQYFELNKATFMYPKEVFISSVIDNSNLIYNGGGLRTHTIELTDDYGNSYRTEYEYSNGVTTYAPNTHKRFIPYQQEIPAPMVIYQKVSVEEFGNSSSKGIVTNYYFEVPASASDYNGITNKNFNMGGQLDVNNSQCAGLGSITGGNHEHYTSGRSAIISDRTSNIGRLNEQEVLNYDQGTGIYYPISNVKYNYMIMDQNSTGVIQETFKYYKRYISEWRDHHAKSKNYYTLGSTSKIQYASALRSVSYWEGGRERTIYYEDYDFYTGSVMEMRTVNDDGTEYKSVAVPAYTKDSYDKYTEGSTVYGGMDSKLWDINNKNMLTQEAASYQYIKNAGGGWDLTGVGIQTWNDQWVEREYVSSTDRYQDNYDYEYRVWRKHKTFIWDGDIDDDGTYSNFTDFDWDLADLDDNESEGWKKTNEVTRYNHWSVPLEAKDINGNYVATKMGYDEDYVIANVANANYCSFAYTGFESQTLRSGWLLDFDGEVLCSSGENVRMASDSLDKDMKDGDGSVAEVEAHTGLHYLKIIPGGFMGGFKTRSADDGSGLAEGRTYRASVWVYNDSPYNTKLYYHILNSSNSIIEEDYINKNDANNITVEDWTLLTINIDVPESDVAGENYQLNVYVWNAGSSDAYIDDFRVHPVDAPLASYAYDHVGRLLATLDNENLATIYKYDDRGRLYQVMRETVSYGLKAVNQYNYNYARDN
ncbi:MAG: hypothetical protein ABIJ97_15675, partial [Bacteroidota bacterium]